MSSPLENLRLKFTTLQFAYKNSGFWDQIIRGELLPQRCTHKYVGEGVQFYVCSYFLYLCDTKRLLVVTAISLHKFRLKHPLLENYLSLSVLIELAGESGLAVVT